MTKLERKVKRNCISFFFQGQRSSILAALVISVILFCSLFENNQTRAFYWLTGSLGLCSLRFLFLIFAHSKNQLKTDKIIRNENLYVCVYLAHGFTWGVLPYLFMENSTPQQSWFITVVILGVLAGSQSNSSASLKASLAYIFSISVPFLSYFLLLESMNDKLISVCCIFMIAFLTKSAFYNYKNVWKLNEFALKNDIFLHELKAKHKLKEQLTKQKIINSHRDKLASLGELAGGISHEINNPLQVIQSASSYLKKKNEDRTLDPDKAGEVIEKILITCNRIDKIIKGLLIFTRNAEEIKNEELNVESLLNKSLPFFEEKFHQAGINLETNYRSKATFSGNLVTLGQVILNLLKNSLDELKDSTNPWIRVESFEDQEYVYLKITDSGQGIPKELAKNIFNPFYTTKKVGEGTGLGLSISKNILTKHRGDIYIDHECKNTRFVIKLPRSKQIRDKKVS